MINFISQPRKKKIRILHKMLNGLKSEQSVMFQKRLLYGENFIQGYFKNFRKFYVDIIMKTIN